MENFSKFEIENIIREVLLEKLGACCQNNGIYKDKSGILKAEISKIQTSEADRMDTGKSGDVVYTHDLFSLAESPRLGVGIMEMRATTFDWHLQYDEVQYVIEGKLDVVVDGREISATKGELILVPKNSKIKFKVDDFARFIYITYPADWAKQ